jgi:hypothetical protein
MTECWRDAVLHLVQMRHDADVRLQVLETALRQIAEQPSDDPETLQQIAATALEQAGEARSRQSEVPRGAQITTALAPGR